MLTESNKISYTDKFRTMKTIFLALTFISLNPIYANESHTGTGKPHFVLTGLSPMEYMVTEENCDWKNRDTPRFAYAEFIYQISYGQIKQWVNGLAVPEKIRRAVAATTLRHEALEILGNEGWELTSTITRNFDNGFEIFFYLKKPAPGN